MARPAAFAAIDVGSSTVATVVGDLHETGSIRILGMGLSASEGVEKGQISAIGKATEAIAASVAKAERSSGSRIVSAGVGISGAHLACLNNRGIVAIPDVGRPISGDDAQRAIDAARTVSLKSNREMLHALPRYYVVDSQDRVLDPVGMHGQRLDVEMHIVTAAISPVQNLMKCVEGAGVQVDSVIATPVAAAEGVLRDEEAQEGTALIDIGGGTTDIAVYEEGAIVHTTSLPVGGGNVTRDLVQGLRCPFAVAEEAKVQYGSALPQAVDPEHAIPLPSFGEEKTREVRQRFIAEVIEARIEEILGMAMAEIRRAGFGDRISAGLVLAGGTSDLRGIASLAESVTKLPVRVGTVADAYGLTDQLAGASAAAPLALLRWVYEGGDIGSNPISLRMPGVPGLFDLVRGVGRLGKVFLPQ